MITNEKFKLSMFVVYTIFFETLVWGMVASAIYFLDWSPLIIVVGIFMSAAQLRAKHFGLRYKDDKDD